MSIANQATYNSQQELNQTMNNTIQTIDTTMQEPTQFDLNSIFIAALTQAITQATAPLVARIATLERSLVVADKAAQGNESDLFSRVAELETKLNNLQDTNANFIKEIAEEVADAKMAEHTDEYDHYEMECQIERIDDKIDEKVNEALDDLDISDKINDALNGATVSISV